MAMWQVLSALEYDMTLPTDGVGVLVRTQGDVTLPMDEVSVLVRTQGAFGQQ